MSVRDACRGTPPLTGRLEPWQTELLDQPDAVSDLIAKHGSPVNLINSGPMRRNAAELQDAAGGHGLDLRINFARKANKALCLVDEAANLGLGVDLASERELRQVLDRGLTGPNLVMTAAVKPEPLLRLCLETATTVAIDNLDELRAYSALAAASDTRPQVALRLAPRVEGGAPTRFGVPMETARELTARDLADLDVAGVHFHLDGYSVSDRVQAIEQSLELVSVLEDLGQRPTYLDIGGGVPMTYLDSTSEWEAFWEAHRSALLGDGDSLTYDGHGLGLNVHDGQVIGQPAVYPYRQSPVRKEWLDQILGAAVALGERTGTAAEALKAAGLALHCQPGRALLDGCGMTAARVEFRKQRADGTWLIGLAMNRTQCRSNSEDFLVDPLVLRPSGADEPTEAISGYLVGAYCAERELLSWRRFEFPAGIAIGDLVVFPNTAGYLMHILESASHQIPLARNLDVSGSPPRLDPIDSLH